MDTVSFCTTRCCANLFDRVWGPLHMVQNNVTYETPYPPADIVVQGILTIVNAEREACSKAVETAHFSLKWIS